jgi:hypothetical protein
VIVGSILLRTGIVEELERHFGWYFCLIWGIGGNMSLR